MPRFFHASVFRPLSVFLLLLGCHAAAQAQVTYYEIVARHSGKCLDVSGASTATGALLHQWDCVGVQNQQWQIIDVGGGYSKIVARHTGKVADVANGSLTNGAAVWQMDENGTPAQQWQITSVGSGYYKILARHSGKALDVAGGYTTNGTQVHQWDYVGIANQQWQLRAVTPPPYDHYELLARHSNKCLDVDNASTANGAKVQQFDCNGTAAQKWQISGVGGGFYRLLARNSGKALDVAGAGTANNTPVHQWDYVGIANQQWQIVDVGGGYYKLLARHSGKALDVPDYSTLNGIQIIQHDYVATTNQQWLLRGVALNRAPNTPVITEPSTNGKIVHPADVHMETQPLSDPDGSLHVCSDWEIVRVANGEKVWQAPCASGPSRTHIHLGDGAFINSLAGQTSLAPLTDYRLRTRHNDGSGDPVTQWSPWAERTFRTSDSGGGIPGQMWQAAAGYSVELVATGFQLPVNIAFIPNAGNNPTDPYFYVTELYGTIKVVTRDGTVSDYATNVLNFDPTGPFPGSGEKGLTGIVVDPVTRDVIASMVYQPDPLNNQVHVPRIMRFSSTNGGKTSSSRWPILEMPGEAQGPSHQISNLTIGPDGNLYVHIGDGFVDNREVSQNLDSFQGKVLRMTLNGAPLANNPFYTANGVNTARDYVWAYGFRNPFGGAWRLSDGHHYEVENGPDVNDRFAKVTTGTNYGWSNLTRSSASMTTNALHTWVQTVAPVNVTFIQSQIFNGSEFPSDKWDHAFVSLSGPTYASGPTVGKRISEFVLNSLGQKVGEPTTLVQYIGTGKATIAGLAAGPRGLYFTDLYKNDGTQPTDRGANVWVVRKPPQ